MINDYIKGNYWQVDQNFLRECIYPIVKNNCMVHDEYNFFNDQCRPFPTKRLNKEFVGDVFDEHNQRHTEYYKLIK